MLAPVDALTGLAHRARAGDERALESFVDLAYQQVWRLCGTLVDSHTADDLAQETFLRAIRALARYRGKHPPEPGCLASPDTSAWTSFEHAQDNDHATRHCTRPRTATSRLSPTPARGP